MRLSLLQGAPPPWVLAAADRRSRAARDRNRANPPDGSAVKVIMEKATPWRLSRKTNLSTQLQGQ